MTHGTAVIGIGTHGHSPHGDTTDGMTHITTEDGTTHGTTDTADGTDTVICILTTADGTEDGIHIGDIITTTISLEAQRRTETSGMAAATRVAQTEYSQAEFQHAVAHQAAR